MIENLPILYKPKLYRVEDDEIKYARAFLTIRWWKGREAYKNLVEEVKIIDMRV